MKYVYGVIDEEGTVVGIFKNEADAITSAVWLTNRNCKYYSNRYELWEDQESFEKWVG